MPMNRIQFQPGLSLPAFFNLFGTEAQCEAALELERWPQGFRCPCCGQAGHSVIRTRIRKTYQCKQCRKQTSLIAGTLFQATHLPLTVWFLAIYLVSLAKTGLSSLAMTRQLGVSYPTALLLHHKLMQTMAERDARHPLDGKVQVDDAYLGGELPGGKPGRGSENKVPFVAAVSTNAEGHPLYVKMVPVPGFTLKAIGGWAQDCLSPGCVVVSDGLACFAAVADAGCQHRPFVVGARKPRDLPQFKWVNTIVGNLKTSLGGTYHAFDFAKYGTRYLGAFSYRFNRRFRMDTIPLRLLAAATAIGPRPGPWLRLAEETC